jgi:hypothetical protein
VIAKAGSAIARRSRASAMQSQFEKGPGIGNPRATAACGRARGSRLKPADAYRFFFGFFLSFFMDVPLDI